MSTFSKRPFTVKAGSDGSSLDIQISSPDGISADNLPLATWGSAQILADVLHRIDIPKIQSLAQHGHDNAKGDEDVEKLDVLELGAGTGLAGITAAAIWHVHVVLTDLAPIIPGIHENISLNQDLVASRAGSVRCGVLDWSRPETLSLRPSTQSSSSEDQPSTDETLDAKVNKARVILAADTIYAEEHAPLLTQTITAWLDRDENARLIFCWPLRTGYLDHINDLWARLEGAGLESIQEGREQVDQSWDEDVPYEWCVWRWRPTS